MFCGVRLRGQVGQLAIRAAPPAPAGAGRAGMFTRVKPAGG